MIQSKHTRMLIFAVCLALGFMLAYQLKTHNYQKSIIQQRAEELTERLRAAEKDREELTKQLEQLRLGYEENSANNKRLQAMAGELPLVGKGVVVTIEDSTLTLAQTKGQDKNLYIIHDEDLLRVINELRAAGAEALALNDQRLLATSEVRCAGPTVVVNDTRVAAPFVIKAIGNPQTMESALKIRGGVLENFKFWGIQSNIETSTEVVIPASKRGRSFEFAKEYVPPEKQEQEGKEQDKAAAAQTQAPAQAQAVATGTEKQQGVAP